MAGPSSDANPNLFDGYLVGAIFNGNPSAETELENQDVIDWSEFSTEEHAS